MAAGGAARAETVADSDPDHHGGPPTACTISLLKQAGKNPASRLCGKAGPAQEVMAWALPRGGLRRARDSLIGRAAGQDDTPSLPGFRPTDDVANQAPRFRARERCLRQARLSPDSKPSHLCTGNLQI